MIIIDLGSNYIKYGLSGTKKPLNILVSKIYKNNDDYDLKKDTNKNRILKYIEPIKNGIIVNFDKMDIIWNKIFDDLNITQTKNSDIILSEPLFVSQEYKDKLKNHLINKYNFKNIYFFNQQYLALLGYCCTCGIIIDIGYTSTKIVPICDNYIIKEAIIIISLSKYNYEMHIKNNMDYKNITINDYYLNPLKINIDEISITQALYNCIIKCPIDLKKKLCNNIIIIGGANYDLGNEMKQDFNKFNLNIPINLIIPNNKNIIVWLGGSIMATLLNINGKC